MTQKLQAGKTNLATSRNVGNAITGASAGAVVGVAGGPLLTVIGAVVGAAVNVAAGVWGDKKSDAKIGEAYQRHRVFRRRPK